MTDETNGSDGSAAAGDDKNKLQVRVVGQYIKDLSFESPNVAKLLEGPIESPNIQLEVNVNAGQVGPGFYESSIEFTASANSKAGKLYTLEIVYGGMFKLENMPEQAVEPFLLINAPALLFPFIRRMIADLTREGGFPPLMLDPIDFATLYLRRKQSTEGTKGQRPVN